MVNARDQGQWPFLSVVIPTRNRPDDLKRCLESLVAVRFPHWDVMVVDQSDETSSKEIVDAFVGILPNLRHLPHAGKGAAHARNTGAEATTGDYIAFLDDDCTVRPTWLENVAHTFERHPNAAIVYGRVVALPHNPNEFYVTTANIQRERAWIGRLNSLWIKGIGAAMSVRRSAYATVGPLDVHFGPGSGFAPAAEEEDYCYRCLSAGYAVVETPSVIVTHFGARATHTGEAGHLVSGYGFAGGMLAMKLVRTGDLIALALLCGRLWQYCLWVRWNRVLLRRKASGLKRLAMFLSGLKASFELGVDRRRCLYRNDGR